MMHQQLLNTGDLLVSRRALKAWENDKERGTDGLLIDAGEIGIILQSWTEINQIRVRLLIKNKIALFSHKNYCIWLNWSRVQQEH